MTTVSPEASFEALKNNTLEAIKSFFPYESRKRRLVVENLRVDDHLSTDDIRSQADAKDREGTWGVPVKAHLKLIDVATGKVLDEKKDATLARLPKMTNRFGFIVNGSEYQVDHLFRLKSGVYAREQNNGDLESEFNLAKNPLGKNFSIKFDRESRKFSFKLDGKHIPLYPILKTMGVSDDELEHAWGKTLFAANHVPPGPKFDKGLRSFWEKTSEDGVKDPESGHAYAKHVAEVLDGMALRPDTTKITLGKAHEKVTGEVLAKAAHNILEVSRGNRKPDDRDSLAFKETASIEDFIPEKIAKGSSRSIKARLRQSIDHKEKVTDILSADLFNRPIHEFFTKGGGVTERSDQTNPIQMLSAHRKTTLMAKDVGGISNENQLTQEMRRVNPSHFGFLDPMHTPESARTGITLYLSANVRKNGKDLEAPAYNLKTGKTEFVKAPDFHEAMAVLPDQVRWENGKPVPIASKVRVKMPGGEIETRPFKEANYVVPSAKGMFGYASNLIPFLPCDQGNRVSMADKQIEQAISLKHRQAPLVQSKADHPHDDEHTFEKMVGNFTATKAPVAGKVVAVNKGSIHIKDAQGKKHEVQVYDHFPLNDPKGMMHSDPLVEVGHTVKKGDIVADSNFTRKGALAIGTNLHVGYLPYKGYNFEDGIVISESAASKLTSEHLYKKDIEIDPMIDTVSKAKLRAHATTRAAKMSKDHWDALDENGVIKPGTRLEPGQVMVAAVGKDLLSKRGQINERLGRKGRPDLKDKSLTWDEDHVGIVTKVVKNPAGRGFKVYVKTEEPAVIGDKLSGRHGNKGIITDILPDHKMPFTMDPHTKEQRPLEVLLNPSGIPTRINMGQMFETAVGKIAEKTGKPYLVDNFENPNGDYRAQILKDLKTHGLSDEEHVFDPDDTRKPLGSVLVGPQYLLKLKHQVEKKLTVRGGGTSAKNSHLPYDMDHQPQKGGEHGGQGFGQLDMYALLGHDARNNLREMATYKSDEQDGIFWSMVQKGREPPPPKPPFTYHKFTALLKGLGVNVNKDGTGVRLSPMTNREIHALAGDGKNEITKGHLALKAKNLKEEPHGLFDPVATGGLHGDKWAFMRLAEPMPNPIFVGHGNRPGPVPELLGLDVKNDIDAIISGKKELNGMTGGAAIEQALKKIDVKTEVKKLKEELPTLTGAVLDRANKKLKYLLALEKSGLKPHEAYILHSIPVVPPKFRPVVETPQGLNVSSLNGLYKNIATTNDEIAKFNPKIFKESRKHPLRESLWDSLKALQSVGNYKDAYDVDASGNRKLKGILDIIGGGEGEQPKQGYFQAKLIKRKQNLSIRSTIVPEPSLSIDQVGLPRDAALELYKPFVVAQLAKWNYNEADARVLIRKGGDVVMKALDHAIKDRPLLLKRDPVLHKFSVMAFNPVLVGGKAIKIHPLVTGGFNADFDGDTMAGTVPLSKAAVEEAKRMFPSKNLFSPTTGGVVYSPSQESLLGLHLLTKWGKASPKSFDSVTDLEKAVEKGELHVTDVVKVKDLGAKPTTLGRLKIAARLPKGMAVAQKILHDEGYQINKDTLSKEIIPVIAKQHSDVFAKHVDDLKNLGNEYSFKMGFSFGLKDLAPIKDRNKILTAAHKTVADLKKTIKDKDHLEAKTIEVYQKATEAIDAATEKQLTAEGNRLGTMIYSGARGKRDQLRQMIAAPMLMQDSLNRIIPTPVTKSYAEGLDVGDYWLAQHGARKGTIQRALGTSEPGAISKDILNTTMSTLISSQDCGTNQGIAMRIGGNKKIDKDVYDRFTARPYKLKDGTHIKEGTLLTPEIVGRLVNNKEDKVLVRSPLKCSHGEGICAKCFGLNENGRLHDTGVNIGVLAGQALGEPAVQMAMDAFHSGGVASSQRGAKSVDRFTRLQQLLKMPGRMRDQATIAMASGKITRIQKDPGGGADVFIDGQKHLIPAKLFTEKVVDEDGREIHIRPGTEIQRGQRLSEGHISPHTLLAATKDIHTVQNHLTDEMYTGLYEKEGVRRRNVEVAVRSLTNLTKIKDPGHSDWFHGDVVPRSVVEEHNRKLPKGHKEVEHEPFLKGVVQIPSLASTNWMARLNYQRIHDTIQQAAGQGWTAELHGSNPVPGIAHGAEFGKPPPGKAPHSY
jgi:DNA-directed RNA polymerase subunit beta'